jgi:hypothetical protein
MSIEISELKKLKLDKDDVLLVSVDNYHLSIQQKENIAISFRSVLPENKIIVVGAGFSLGVITKESLEALNS